MALISSQDVYVSTQISGDAGSGGAGGTRTSGNVKGGNGGSGLVIVRYLT